ncbi:MAG: DUF975 family protein [Lachnospiraceae bacterium]|nr:DUF975 family protein [Candidatus Equihabitans merdae]
MPEAVTLPRRMMKGHKWEAFVLELSFIGWQILDHLTLGLTGIFYSNPYHESTLAEYYAYVRQQAIDNKIQGYEALNDQYLFRKATEEELKAAYADRKIVDLEPEDYSHMSPVKRFTRNVLGVCLFYDKDEDIYEARILQEEVQKDTVSILAGKQYPGRLFTVSEKEKVKRIEHLNYLRHYSVCSLILIFFTICFGGWLWEVSIHLVKDGVFVNRGILHGPWLPIYGTGVVMILLILNKLRKNPFVQFASAIVLCGCLEYFTSYYLEVTHNGMKWWDYTGYFININGRVCAEGLLVFGLGGVAAVYLLAPLLDTSFRRIPVKKAAVICLVLMLIFTADQIYSSKHPNAGKGVTDYDTVVPVEMETGHR